MAKPPTSSSSRPSRRQFLATTAAAAGAAPLLGSCSMLGSSRPLPKAAERARARPDETLRIGVIGTGGMGTAHCSSLLQLAADGKEDLRIVALADVCQSRLENAQQKCGELQEGKPDSYGDHAELLARSDLHGVLIATPEHWHAPMVEDAVARGLDVYVEKPMTLRLPGALRLHQVQRANPHVIVQVGTQFLTHEKYHKARQLIADGAIGKPTSSQASYCRNSKTGEWLYYDIDESWEPGVNLDWDRWCGPMGQHDWSPEVYARWRRYRAWSTGICGDLLVHMMTPMMFAVDQGWPVRVVAVGGHYKDKAMENHDQVDILVQFEKGHTMRIAGSTCNERGDETMIRGHRASLFLGSKDCTLRPERIYAEEIDEETLQCPPQSGDHDRMRLDWLSCMRTRKANLGQVELATQVMVVVDLATRSMWDGKAFAFDPEAMRARAV
ncbi:MAG: Gfo/Idh/MocA family oxidoreductase [Planctomycetota bacterium]